MQGCGIHSRDGLGAGSTGNLQAHPRIAGFVVDEHGEVLGLITLTDVLEAIVGDLGDEDEAADS